MRKFLKVMSCVLVVMALFSTTAFAKKTVEEKRAELRVKTNDALELLYQKQPKARTAIRNAYGYAVFVDTSFTLGVFGSGHGRGRAINRNTGTEIFMKVKEYQVGLGFGVRQANTIFVFDNIQAFSDFVRKGWSYGGHATAAVTDGVHGDTLEGSFQVAPGTWLYQVSTKGLSAEVGLKGTNFYVDNDLNTTKIPKTK